MTKNGEDVAPPATKKGRTIFATGGLLLRTRSEECVAKSVAGNSVATGQPSCYCYWPTVGDPRAYFGYRYRSGEPDNNSLADITEICK